MVFHIGLSLLHSLPELLTHLAIFLPLLHLLFRRSTTPYFHAETGTTG
jgi:hypothetical protein